MISAYLVIDSMRRTAKRYADMQMVVFDAFIPINLGPQYIQTRNADFWIVSPEGRDAMTEDYLQEIQARAACRPGSRIVSLDEYLEDQFFSEDM